MAAPPPAPPPAPLMHVGVIGAGIAGLATARALRMQGFGRVSVWDEQGRVGGVWASAYHGAAVQAARHLYQLPDFAWARDAPAFPTAERVLAYLEAYVKHADLGPCLRLSQRVVRVRRCPGDVTAWTVETQRVPQTTDTPTATEHTHVDYLVVCAGRNHCGFAVLPPLSHRDLYQGRVLHSCQVVDADVIAAAEHVIVIGNSKSALDMGMIAPDKTTVVHRSQHWWLQRWLTQVPWFDLIFRFYASQYHRRVIRGRGNSVARALLRFVDRYVFPALGSVAVNHPKIGSLGLYDDMLRGGGYHVGVSRSMLRAARQWRVARGSPVRYHADGIELDSGQRLRADVIVFATGFAPAPAVAKLFAPEHGKGDGADGDDGDDQGTVDVSAVQQGDLSDGLYLWRYKLHPDLPGVAFVGMYDAALSASTHAVEAEWVARYLAGTLAHPPPPPEQQRKQLQQRIATSRQHVPVSRNRASRDIFQYSMLDPAYVESMLADTGVMLPSCTKPSVLLSRAPTLTRLSVLFPDVGQEPSPEPVPIRSADPAGSTVPLVRTVL